VTSGSTIKEKFKDAAEFPTNTTLKLRHATAFLKHSSLETVKWSTINKKSRKPECELDPFFQINIVLQ